jgi:hypothetical protein
MSNRAALLLSLVALVACNNPETTDLDGDGFVTAEDCDDGNSAINPDAEEVCDGLDNNCDGELDEGVLLEFFIDGDADGYGDGDAALACEAPGGMASVAGDCDDSDADIHPDATEVCDLVDNNCDGTEDEGVTTTYYRDGDLDGYGVESDSVQACELIDGFSVEAGDCDDEAAEIYPNAPLACNGTDQDCDGNIDNDADMDGYSDAACGGLDCDDADPANFDECTPGLEPGSPGVDCLDIITVDPTVPNGTYWIDPNEGDPSDSFQVMCDMETDGGGWTLTFLVDGENFDALYSNNRTISDAPPTALNSQADIWNAERFMPVNELLYACSTQDAASTHFWTYRDTSPHTWFTDEIGNYNYQTINSASTNSTAATCMSTYNAVTSAAFIVIEADSCGSCNTMLYGMYHYPGTNGRAGCNSTDTTYGAHASPYDGRSIEYPICAGLQTTNGNFWMGIR